MLLHPYYRAEHPTQITACCAMCVYCCIRPASSFARTHGPPASAAVLFSSSPVPCMCDQLFADMACLASCCSCFVPLLHGAQQDAWHAVLCVCAVAQRLPASPLAPHAPHHFADTACFAGCCCCLLPVHLQGAQQQAQHALNLMVCPHLLLLLLTSPSPGPCATSCC
jgi:hypothetical protein